VFSLPVSSFEFHTNGHVRFRLILKEQECLQDSVLRTAEVSFSSLASTASVLRSIQIDGDVHEAAFA